MKDYIVSATAEDGFIRAYAATTGGVVEASRKIHDTLPVVTAALGRLMTATVIMGSMLKGDEIITCRISGDGELGGIIAVADAYGHVKGYPHNPYVALPLNKVGKLDVSGAIGNGSLNVSKDLGLKEPYVGEIPLVSGEIAEDFAQYYVQSEQTNSAVALGVLVDRDHSVLQSGGFIIQLMPGASPSIAETLTERLDKLPPVTTILNEGKTPEQILEVIFSGMSLIINKTIPAEFKCNCSYEKLYKVVVALGKEELRDILDNEKQAELKCHFCNKKYHFDETALQQILESCD